MDAAIDAARGWPGVVHARFVARFADGRLKYTADRLWQDKRRQELIERAGYRVVRVTWDDVVNHPAETMARVAAALRSSGPV